MPELTPKLGIKKPLGNETVSRAVFNENYDIIDQNAASQAQVDQPFYLKSAVYDSVNNRLDLTIGPGRAAFLGTLITQAVDNHYYISAPAPSTSYYIYIKSDSTYTHNTTGAEVSGAVQIWKVTTGATVDQITTEDRRGQLPGASGRIAQDNLNTHKTAATLDHPDGSVTSTKLGALAVIAGKIADGAVDTLARIAAAIRTTAGGTEANRLAVTNASGRVGDSEKLVGMVPTSAATVSTIMQRDAAGRAKVAAPAATDDIARKAEVDTVQDNLNTHLSNYAHYYARSFLTMGG